MQKQLPTPPGGRSGEPSPQRRSRERLPHSGVAEAPSMGDDDGDEFEFFHEFEREKVKGVIHEITAHLKKTALDVEYLMIPFRPEQTNERLLKFLNAMFPLGNGQAVGVEHQVRLIRKTDPFVLFQALKYVWCRLPNGEIVGWNAYSQFKFREIDREFPQKAFLEIMPQCLDSPNHASIVYDFLDLIVTISSNSKVNKMSARKISKLCAVWAFNKPTPPEEEGQPSSWDFDNSPKYKKINNSFQDGLDQWIPASDAMFHLLLAFLKSFVPEDLESSKLPRSLKSILFNNEYPPKGSTAYSSQTILTIPLVTLTTDQFSRKPWQLLERCNELLNFENYDGFQAREDYVLLKSLFKKRKNVEGISRKMSQESRRLMKLMSTKHSTFQAGWAQRKCLPNPEHLKEFIQVGRVDIDDYFIWTWLSTLSYEQTLEKKKIFGRSLILEFEFDGFKKWVAFQESDITLANYSKPQLKNPPIQETEKKEEETITKAPAPAKTRIASPIYDQFQSEVPNVSVTQKPKTNYSKLSGATSTPQGKFHTVINKDALSHKNKSNNLQAFEQKISKWNPLSNLRKKSGSGSSERSAESTSSTVELLRNTSSVYDPTPAASVKLHNRPKINLHQPPMPDHEEPIAPQNHDVMKPLPLHEENIPETTGSLPMDSVIKHRLDTAQSNPHISIDLQSDASAQAALEELNGMMEQMMAGSDAITEEEGSISMDSKEHEFEQLTKFEKYKQAEFAAPENETYSPVASLQIPPATSIGANHVGGLKKSDVPTRMSNIGSGPPRRQLLSDEGNETPVPNINHPGRQEVSRVELPKESKVSSLNVPGTLEGGHSKLSPQNSYVSQNYQSQEGSRHHSSEATPQGPISSPHYSNESVPKSQRSSPLHSKNPLPQQDRYSPQIAKETQRYSPQHANEQVLPLQRLSPQNAANLGAHTLQPVRSPQHSHSPIAPAVPFSAPVYPPGESNRNSLPAPPLQKQPARYSPASLPPNIQATASPRIPMEGYGQHPPMKHVQTDLGPRLRGTNEFGVATAGVPQPIASTVLPPPQPKPPVMAIPHSTSSYLQPPDLNAPTLVHSATSPSLQSPGRNQQPQNSPRINQNPMGVKYPRERSPHHIPGNGPPPSFVPPQQQQQPLPNYNIPREQAQHQTPVLPPQQQQPYSASPQQYPQVGSPIPPQQARMGRQHDRNVYYPANANANASGNYFMPPQPTMNNRYQSASPNRMTQLQQGYAGYVHNAPYSQDSDTGTPPPPSTIPMAMPHGNPVGMKLHGHQINKRQDRRQLYDNIRSGNFGI
ncbi:Msb1p KNAG_0M00910 [Huiozyma naganishii CBS 8797]|uniref:Meiotically up-regulated protein Msb1/Mug8 domain-containing protein n=1 Tax=Huiozyma naganishii (strain ATCC MYA-139 / BCRC 22969 / CBS 8797 / KCTC 17520 / NBRC 10181 / NCYC 3082 / Yp74L-3) TaxID=1071383 RepID=J7SAQ4_HUIN7|nr:hypothetical protein KNAG_0M00910 [Kazachstania naganishii CBS 8797]CCK72944.1 hypothetical protein KNAG_0M00910 [Kazachstania naganishii CBS 8797]